MVSFFTRLQQQRSIVLNETQQQAVLHDKGPLLLLACPGSGKTTTMIARIAYLIEEKRVSPERIHAITFSKASAHDMKKRFQSLFPHIAFSHFSTIHSLAFQIVRSYFAKQGISYSIIEGTQNRPQKMQLLKQIYEQVLQEESDEELLLALSTFISAMKNRMVPKQLWKMMEPFSKASIIALRYEDMKESQGHRYLDFDDMLTIAEEALRTDETIRMQFSSRTDYMLTDESQDTSLVQHKMIEQLVKDHRQLWVVADDDQTIYTWRGASPDYLLDFTNVYPDAHLLKLEQNYRSSKTIVEAATTIIQRNDKRYAKKMFTLNVKGPPIHLQRFENKERLLDYVIYELLAEQELGEVAILYRNNASSTEYVNELHRRGIPFYMKDADDKFFSHWVVADVLNFMRLSYNLTRKDIFSKIAMKMNLFLSRSMLRNFQSTSREGNVFEVLAATVDLSKRQVEKVKEYQTIYEKIKDLRPAQVIRVIRYELEYEEALKSLSDRYGYRFDTLIAKLDTLEQIAIPHRTMAQFAHQLTELEAAVHQAKKENSTNAVTLSTFHSAKGLEFKRVFMVDLVEGIIPSKEDKDDVRLLEEARRLFYVGMTRAKEQLHLLSYEKQGIEIKASSRFINEIQPSISVKEKAVKTNKSSTRFVKDVSNSESIIETEQQLQVGKKIIHRVFGKGSIVEVDAVKLSLQFGQVIKTFDTKTILTYQLLEYDRE